MHSASNRFRNGFSKVGIVCIKIVCWPLNSSGNRVIKIMPLINGCFFFTFLWGSRSSDRRLATMILAKRVIYVYNLDILIFKNTIYHITEVICNSLSTTLKMKIEHETLLYSRQPEIIIINIMALFSLQMYISLCPFLNLESYYI